MLVVFRKDLKHLDPSLFNDLAERLKAGPGTLRVVVLAANADRKAVVARRAAARQANEQAIRAGGKGYGYLIFPNDSRRLCTITDDPDELWSRWLDGNLDALQRDLAQRVTLGIQHSDADAAYVAARRGECRVVLGAAPQLARVWDAAVRDHAGASMGAIWITDAQHAGIENALDEQVRANHRRAEQMSEQQVRARLVEANSRQEQANRRAAATAALRAVSGPRATAMKDRLSEAVRNLFGPTPEEKTWLASGYPDLAAEAADLRDKGWELDGSPAATIEEFGPSNWGNRKLDTVVLRVTVPMKNRTIGQYRTVCHLLGYQQDSEFAMIRGTRTADCDAPGRQAIADWLAGLLFQSQWNAPSRAVAHITPG